MAVVVFNIEKFRSLHPHLADVSDAVLNLQFGIAEQIVGNKDGASLAPYDPDHGEVLRETLLDLATCHLTTLSLQPTAQSGRITNASEGSVSTGFDLIKANTFTGDWWAQTQCGQLYWIMTADLRLGGRLYAANNYHPWG